MLNGTTLNGAPLDGRGAQAPTGTAHIAAAVTLVALVAFSTPVPLVPIVSAPPIPAPLAILGSTAFVDLADPPIVILPPIRSAPIAPPPVPTAPLKPQSGFVALALVSAPSLTPLTISAAPAHAPIFASAQFIATAAGLGNLSLSPFMLAPPAPAVGLALAIDKAFPGATMLVSGDTQAPRTLGVSSDAVTRNLETKE